MIVCLAVVLLVPYAVRWLVGLAKKIRRYHPMKRIRILDKALESWGFDKPRVIPYLVEDFFKGYGLPVKLLVILLVGILWAVGAALLPISFILYMVGWLIRLARKFIRWQPLEKIDAFFKNILESEIMAAEMKYVLAPVLGGLFLLFWTLAGGFSYLE